MGLTYFSGLSFSGPFVSCTSLQNITFFFRRRSPVGTQFLRQRNASQQAFVIQMIKPHINNDHKVRSVKVVFLHKHKVMLRDEVAEKRAEWHDIYCKIIHVIEVVVMALLKKTACSKYCKQNECLDTFMKEQVANIVELLVHMLYIIADLYETFLKSGLNEYFVRVYGKRGTMSDIYLLICCIFVWISNNVQHMYTYVYWKDYLILNKKLLTQNILSLLFVAVKPLSH